MSAAGQVKSRTASRSIKEHINQSIAQKVIKDYAPPEMTDIQVVVNVRKRLKASVHTLRCLRIELAAIKSG